MHKQYTPQHVIDAIKNPFLADHAPRFVLTIDGVQMKEYAGIEWGWGENTSMLLTASLGGRLGDRFQGKQVKLEIEIDGYTSEEFRSAKARFSHDEARWMSKLVATTAGGLAGKWYLEEDLPIAGWSPQAVLLNGAMRLPYDPSSINIASFDLPKITRSEPTGESPTDDIIKEEESVQDLWDTVLSEMEPKPNGYDTARGLIFEHSAGIGTTSPILWEYARGSREVIKWPTPTRVDPDQEYSKVIVLSRNADGTRRIRSVWPIDAIGYDGTPGEGEILYIPFSDESAEADGNANKIGSEAAMAARKGLHQGSAEVIYNPCLYPGKVVTYEEDYLDDDGRWRRKWLCVLDQDVKHSEKMGLISTKFSYKATKLSEIMVAEPPIRVTSVHSVFRSQVVATFAGRDAFGRFWLNPKGAVNSAGVRWMGRDESGRFWINPDISEGLAGRDENGRFFINTG